MKKLLHFSARTCRFAAKRLDRLAMCQDYQDNIPRRDKLISEMYSKIDAGHAFEDVVADPRASRHGERVLEYPLVYRLLKKYTPSDVLDIGCVLNNTTIDPFISQNCSVAFLNPAVEPLVRKRATYFKTDLACFKAPRKFPFVTCLSTLEHIGFDNTRYGSSDAVDEGWDWEQAVRSFVMSLRAIQELLPPEGRAWITCPYGKQEFVCYPRKSGPRVWQVINPLHVAAITDDKHLDGAQLGYYRLTADGWFPATSEESFENFGSVGTGASGVIIIELRGKTSEFPQ